MLSRVASSLYTVGRELENAEHMARLLDCHLSLWLDRGRDERRFWSGVARLTGREAGVVSHRREAVDLVVVGPGAPSIRHSMGLARASALAVRPSLSSEVYENLNDLYWRLEDADRRHLHQMLSAVQSGAHLIAGSVDETMAHDDAWEFLRLGKYLVRARNVARLVTIKSVELRETADDEDEWAAVLRCCSAFEAYRWRFSAPVTPARVVGFLLLDPSLPRSVAFSVRLALEALERIDQPRGRGRAHRLLAKLVKKFSATDPTEVALAPESFAQSFALLAETIEEAVAGGYFRPTDVPGIAASGHGRQQLQQQQ
jgi:uncharacterized alpha-E superfamily protein